MEPGKRKICAAAAGIVLGAPAVAGAVPVFGVAGGIAAALAVMAGGAAGFLLTVPASHGAATPQQRLHPDAVSSRDAIVEACEGIRRSEVAAAIRNCLQNLLVIASDPKASVADMSFVILNMESLLGIAEAWRKTEVSAENPLSLDALAAFTIPTVTDITGNARRRYDHLQKRAVDALQVELAVTRRINEDDRKGFEP